MVELDEKYFTCKELAELLKIHPRTIKRWIASGMIKAYHVGRDLRIPKSEVIGLLVPSTTNRNKQGETDG